jgi:hypothetical protein
MKGAAAFLVLAAVAGVAGCDDSKTVKAEFAKDDAVVSGPPVPTHYEANTPDAKVSLTLPVGIERYPDLHAKLFNDGKQELVEFAAQAASDRQRFAAKGVKQSTPYERRVTWTITAITPHLISLRDRWFDDTGGAHPDHGSDVLLWDRLRGVEVLQSELFKPDADTRPLDDLICEKTRAAKSARIVATDPKRWTCPTWTDSRAVLVPSTQPYRIGGMMLLFDPYVVGAYADGEYEVLIPLADFQRLLSPTWAADFAGAPAPKARPSGAGSGTHA